MPALDFVAVDFETANSKRESACAVGVAVVRDGRVESSDSWLIKPPPPADHFQRMNTALHGISREQCLADGISWAETAQRLGRLCADLPVVAHNASFDESVWRAANRASGVEAPLPSFHCTLQLSRRHLDLVDHKLPTVVRHLGLDDFPHHRAEADALAAAQVTVELAHRTGASTVEELWPRGAHHSAADVGNPSLTGVPGKEPRSVEHIREADDDARAPVNAHARTSQEDLAPSSPVPPPSAWAAPPTPAYPPHAARPRQPWDPPQAARPRQPWDPPLPAPAPPARSERRWVLHAVMWSIMLFLLVGMFVVGFVLSLMGVPESVWAAVIGISWLLVPLVFVAWLIATVVRWLKSRRRDPARQRPGGPADAVVSP